MSIVERMYEYGFRGRPTSKGQWYLNCPVCGKNFAVNTTNGAFICFSAACGIRGNIRKFIGAYETEYDLKNEDDVNEIINELFADKAVIETSDPFFEPPNDEELINYQLIHEYMIDRGFEEEFLINNKIGYKKETHSVTIPIYFQGNYYGCIERTVLKDVKPKYCYPENLPKKSIFYKPLHKAPSRLKSGQEFEKTLIIVEGSLDALKLAQSGFNAMAVLGSNLSEEQAQIIQGYIDEGYEIVLCFDNDEAGRKCTLNTISQFEWLDLAVVDWRKFNLDLTEQVIDSGDGVCDNERVGNLKERNDPGELNEAETMSLIAGATNKYEWLMNN